MLFIALTIFILLIAAFLLSRPIYWLALTRIQALEKAWTDEARAILGQVSGDTPERTQFSSINYRSLQSLSIFAILSIGWIAPALMVPTSPALFAMLAITAALVLMTVVDVKSLLLPDEMTLPLLWAGLLVSVTGITVDPANAIVGAALGYGVFAALNKAHVMLRGCEGMGGGDFKLLAALGAWLGPIALVLIVLIASIAGVIWYVIQRITSNSTHQAIELPFGPWLALGGWATMVFGPELAVLVLGSSAGVGWGGTI